MYAPAAPNLMFRPQEWVGFACPFRGEDRGGGWGVCSPPIVKTCASRVSCFYFRDVPFDSLDNMCAKFKHILGSIF